MKRLTAKRTVKEGTSWNWHSFAVAAAAITCYYPSLRGGLVFDDIAAIKENRDVRPHSPLSSLFLHDFWGTPIQKELSHKSYRPLTTLSFRWNYMIHGLEPWGYHFINVFLHAIVSLLYLRLCRKVLRAEDSLVAALLFAVHPIHTDAVASVVGRAELLSAFFFLTTVLYYWRQRDRTKKKLSQQVWLPVMMSVVLSATGTLCKEQALTSLAVCAIADLFIMHKVPIGKDFFRCILQFRTKTTLWYKAIISRVRLLLGALVLLLVLRIVIMGHHFPVFNRLDNPSAVESAETRVLTYNHLTALNSWLLVFPEPLCCDWSSESVPLVTSLTDWRNCGTIMLYFVVLKLFWQAVCSGSIGTTVRMCLVLMIVPFIPASNLFFPVGFVIAERVLYLPSMGFCMMIAHGWSTLRGQSSRKYIMKAGLGFLLLFHGLRTTRRCMDWESEYTLYESGIEANPRNVKLLNNMGRLLEKWGMSDEALSHFISAVRVRPDDVTGYLNLGNTYTNLQRFQEAEEAYLKATALLPKFNMDDAQSNRVTVQHLKALLRLATLISRNSSRLEEADKLYAQVLSLRRDYTEAYVGWGSLMLRTNRTREAEFVLGKALQQDGEDPNMLYNFGVVLAEQEKGTEALPFFERALLLDPHHEPSLLASARLMQDGGSQQMQEVAFKRLRLIEEMGQADETVYFNLGMLSLKSGDHKNAENWLKQALKLKRDFPEALFNMALLLYDENRPSEARGFVLNLLQLKKNHVKGLLLLGDINVNYVDDLDTAEECYRSVLKVEPSNYQSLHNLCVVYMKRQELERALDCFREALSLAPHVDYIQRHLHLADLLLKNGGKSLDSEIYDESDVLSDMSKRLRHLQFNQ